MQIHARFSGDVNTGKQWLVDPERGWKDEWKETLPSTPTCKTNSFTILVKKVYANSGDRKDQMLLNVCVTGADLPVKNRL